MTLADDRFTRDRILDAAGERVGLSDLGDPSWQEGFDVLLASLVDEAELSPLGAEVALNDLTGYLADRMAITEWRRTHPAVADVTIESPIFIVGQPRTGTTILHDLLAQDPALRSPLTWQVDRPVPPATPPQPGGEPDPRVAEVDAQLEMANMVIPGFTDFHPMGAELSQECVRMTASEFRSMIFPVQYRVPTYDRWLLDEADLGPAYQWHRLFLQHLGSAWPTEQWLLKSPAHLWHLDDLVAEYPDAVVIQTHRDPLKVIASVSALSAHLCRMTTDDPSLPDIARDYAHDIVLGLDRGMDARARNVIPADRVVDVQFRDFVTDPFTTIRRVYDAMGRELTDEAEAAMRQFLVDHPGDGGGGGTRYRWADTGLDADELRERVRAYQEQFDVPSEPLA